MDQGYLFQIPLEIEDKKHTIFPHGLHYSHNVAMNTAEATCFET